MKFQPFAFYAIALVSGILLQNYFELSTESVFALLVGSFFIFCFSFFTKKTKVFTYTSLFLVMFLGAQIYEFHKIPEQIYHVKNENSTLKLKIRERLKSSGRYDKYIAQVLYANERDYLDCKILIYRENDSVKFLSGNELLVKGYLQSIPKPKNPHQFDYSNYMAHREVAFRFFINSMKVVSLEKDIFGFFDEKKIEIKEALSKNEFSRLSIAFISSLGLGDRTDFSPELNRHLSYAGVLHLFAISGMHVGIIFSIIMILLSPLLFLPKGRNIRIIFSILLIWGYTCFIGFSPSVTRASLMLSIYYTTFLLNRPKNIYHTIYISIFILLLIDPNQIFDIGFLLSFLALFFIVYLDPIRLKYRDAIPNKFKRIYDIAMISTFAQLGVLPITLYYFGHFSFLFLGANLLMISIASFLVVLSMIVSITVSIFTLPDFMVVFSNVGTAYIYDIIRFFSSQESFVIHHISWNIIQMIFWIFILFFIKKILEKFNPNYVIAILIAFFIMESSRLVENHILARKHQLILFHQRGEHILGWRKGPFLTIFYKGENVKAVRKFILNEYNRKEKIKEMRIMSWGESFSDGIFRKVNNHILINDTRIILNYWLANENEPVFIQKRGEEIYVYDGGSKYHINKCKSMDNVYFTEIEGAYILDDF